LHVLENKFQAGYFSRHGSKGTGSILGLLPKIVRKLYSKNKITDTETEAHDEEGL